jgi:translation initiation factor IF-1
LSKEDTIEFEGTVVDVLPDGKFRVVLENDHEILAYIAGRMKRHRIRTLAGDRVTVEMTPYDMDKGRITFRHKTDGGGPGPGARRGPPPRRR